MIAEILRKSILQAAIEGKLTEQLPEDGDARDLVAEIKREKEELIKAGKIKKEKPLPEITEDEIPFDIPDNWCWVRLGDISSTNIGLTYSPKDINSEGTIVLRSSNIQDNKLNFDDIVRVNMDIPPSKKTKENDILICVRNGSKRLVGKAALIDGEKYSFGAFMSIIRTPFYRYIYNYISSPYFRQDFDSVSTTTINQITQSNLKSRLVPLPPVDEQIRISEKVNNILPRLRVLDEKEVLLNRIETEFPNKLNVSILQAAMQGKLTDQLPEDGDAHDLLDEIQAEKQKLIAEGKLKKEKPLPPITEEEIPFDIPDNWVWTKLEFITNKVGSKSNQIKKSEIKKTGKIPVITQGKTFIEGYSNDETKVIKEVPVIMFGDHTRNVKYIDFPFIIGADGTQIHQSLINDKYLYYWMVLASEKLKNRGYQRHYTLLKKELIPIPTLSEQKRIADKLDVIMN